MKPPCGVAPPPPVFRRVLRAWAGLTGRRLRGRLVTDAVWLQSPSEVGSMKQGVGEGVGRKDAVVGSGEGRVGMREEAVESKEKRVEIRK